MRIAKQNVSNRISSVQQNRSDYIILGLSIQGFVSHIISSGYSMLNMYMVHAHTPDSSLPVQLLPG